MARSNNEQRNIALNFITNANETRSQITQLMETIDDTSQEYQELVQSSRQLEQATESLTSALNSEAGSASNVQDSIQRLQAQQATATRTINNTRNAINNQTVSMRSLTTEVTSNGGAMAILDTVTGGWATTVKDSIEALALFTTGTNLSTVAQRAYTFVVGTSTGALRAFRIALAATGIGAIVVLVGFLVEAWMNLANATDEATEAQKRFDAQAKVSKQVADERMSDLEFEAEMLREIARERGASIQETRRLETEAYNKRLDELRRQQLDERLSVEDRREAAKKWSQEYNQNLLREQRWRADDAQSARETARATAQNRSKIAKDNSADLRRIEEERIAFLKKVETDYRDWLSVNAAVNPTQGMLAQGEINYRKLQEQRATDLKDAEKYAKNNAKTYESIINTINLFYDVQLNKLKEQKKEIISISTLGTEMTNWWNDFLNSDDVNNITSIDVMRERLIMFVNDIQNPELKKYYEELFDIEGIKAINTEMSKFRNTTKELIDYKPDGDTNILNSLFGVESDGKTSAALRLEENLKLIEEMYKETLFKLSQNSNLSEAEQLEVEKFYNKMSEDERNRHANALIEIDRIQFQQRMQALTAYADLAGATAGLMEEHTAGYKVLAIAQTTIDTYTSAMSAYKGMVQAIPGPVGIAAGAAAAAASVITGISNVKKILAVKVPGGGGTGGGAPSAASATPNVSFVSSSENQIANSISGSINNSNNEPIKAYVVSSDVTTAQQLEKNAINSNSL